MTSSTKFQIVASKLSLVTDRLAFISKKAVKYGFAAPTLSVISEFMYKREGERCETKMLNVEITGETPIIGGWSLAAVIRPAGEHNIISTFPSFEIEIPSVYRTCSPVCEHCKKNRKRTDTFLVWSATEGFKQIGRQCLADFTGDLDPQAAAWLAAYMPKLRELADDKDYAIGGEAYYGMIDFISAAVYVIRTHGWASRATSDRPTAQRAIDLIAERVEPSEEDTAKALLVIKWANDNVATAVSTFESNVFAAVSGGHVTLHTMGFAAYAVVMYDKSMAMVTSSTSNFIGTVGGKITETVTLKSTRKIESYYGVTTMYTFETENGDVIVWWASADKGVNDGDVMSITATVTEHKAYNGVNQTIVTRAKLK